MLKILHLIPSADPREGGPIEGARQMGEVWAAAGTARQDLLTCDSPGAPYLAGFPGKVITLGEPILRSRLSRYGIVPGMVRWLRDHARDYDAVLVSSLWTYSAMVARMALIGGDTPYYVYTHGMLDPWFKRTYPLKHAYKQPFWRLFVGPLLKHATGVLFTTEAERELAEGAFQPYQVVPRIVGYGAAAAPADTAEQRAAFQGAVPALDGRRYLLFLSRIHRKKGCDLLVDAFAAIAADHPDLDLVIAGPDDGHGLSAQLQAQAAERGLAHRIHFPGMLEGAAKWGAFRGCEAFVLPSHQENFGVVVAEAMSCAKPVLITDKVNIWHEVADDQAGLVASDTQPSILDMLHRYLRLSDAERAAMGAAALASFTRRFTVTAAAETLLGLIRRDKKARAS